VSAELSARITEALASSPDPATVREIAQTLSLPPNEIAEVVWGAPERFSWQPGGRWTLAVAKTVARPRTAVPQDDTRTAVLSPRDGVELRAIRLVGGATLRVLSQPLDSAAFFTVRSRGADLQLVFNATHELFERLPMPFESEDGGDHMQLAELVLAAWAIQEAEAPPASRRGLEDARLFWGRRVLELLDLET
jgi:hypothetical protein